MKPSKQTVEKDTLTGPPYRQGDPELTFPTSNIADVAIQRYQTWQDWNEAGQNIEEERNHARDKWQEANYKQDFSKISYWAVKLQELDWRVEEHKKFDPMR